MILKGLINYQSNAQPYLKVNSSKEYLYANKVKTAPSISIYLELLLSLRLTIYVAPIIALH